MRRCSPRPGESHRQCGKWKGKELHVCLRNSFILVKLFSRSLRFFLCKRRQLNKTVFKSDHQCEPSVSREGRGVNARKEPVLPSAATVNLSRFMAHIN